jgi:hypothetical protein
MFRQRFIHRLLSGLIIFSLLLSSAPVAQAQDGPVYLPLVNQGQGQARHAPPPTCSSACRCAWPRPARRAGWRSRASWCWRRRRTRPRCWWTPPSSSTWPKPASSPAGPMRWRRWCKEQGPAWLSPSLRPLLQEAAALRASGMDLTAGRAADQVVALASVRAALAVLAGEQRAALNELTELDSDGDGLTDTEESWWCTDPLESQQRRRRARGTADGLDGGRAALDAYTLPRHAALGLRPALWPAGRMAGLSYDRAGDPATPACNRRRPRLDPGSTLRQYVDGDARWFTGYGEHRRRQV